MAKYLVVVESPAKAKTINKFLGSSYVVRASYGHVRDLPKNDLGVDIENGFEPKYVQLRDSTKAVKALREAGAKVEQILLASDNDREGEAIGWHVAALLEKLDKPVSRIVFNEITKRSVREAAKHPRPINADLVNAQQARRIIDRLLGYKLSPLLQWAVRRGLSAGRVQSVAVRMVCEREDEIRNFVPVEYWTLDADLVTPREDPFTARLNKIRGEKAELGKEDEVQQILAALDNASYSVKSVERKEVRRRPSPPFITSTLQQEASRKLRFGTRKTMVVAQQLYEGIELGKDEGMVGLISYMRTDSTRLAGEALDEVRSFISENFPPGMLPEKPNFYKSKKGAQDAHEAIRPTSAHRTPESMAPHLTDDQLKLYTLIWKRFVACQMAPAILDQTAVDVTAGEYEFRATGSVVKFPGFTTLYEESTDDKNNNNGQDGKLPEINEDEPLDLTTLRPEQHFTKPPPRYSEASLVRALEENGIGRPSTYAPTINTIIERKYVDRDKRRLVPTELGEKVNTLLVAHFPDILNINFTAQLEADLDHVEEGRAEWRELLKSFYADFDKDLRLAQQRLAAELVGEDVKCPECGSDTEVCEGRFGLFLRCQKHPDCKGSVSQKKGSEEATDIECEKCGAMMVIREGRFGRFLACPAYPKCKNTHNIDENGNKVEKAPKAEPRKTDQKCPDCGGFLLIRTNRKGEEFYGCEKYPKCKFTKPMELGLKCLRPGCDGDLVIKMARRRRFVACDKYPGCDFSAFGQLDQKTACPKCGNSWTVINKPRNKPQIRRCPAPNCGHEEEIP